MKSFTISQRSNQNLDEEKHLLTRVQNGLASDRYTQNDYRAFAEFSKRENLKTAQKELKLKFLNKKINSAKESSFIKKQSPIWITSFYNLSQQLSKAERELEYSIQSFYDSVEIIDEKCLKEIQKSINDGESDFKSFSCNSVKAMNNLTSELKSRINKAAFGNIKEKENLLEKVDTTKYEAFNILRGLEIECENLEKDLSYPEQEKEQFSLRPSIEELFTPNIIEMMKQIKSDKVVEKEFCDLFNQHQEKFLANLDEKKLLLKKRNNALWSSKELLILIEVAEIYRKCVPLHMKELRSKLQLEMLAKLLPKKSKFAIIEANTNESKLRFLVKRLNQCKTDFKYDLATFRNRTMALLVDLSEQLRLQEAKSHTFSEQKQICDRLHLELEKMRKKRNEIERLESILAEKELERLNEENQKKEEVKDKRRKKINSQVAEFKCKKKDESLKKQTEMRKQLEKLKEEMKKQLIKDKERVKYREEMYLKKLEAFQYEIQRKEIEEIDKEKRLESLRLTVAVTAEANPARMVQNTLATDARLGLGVNQDVNLQAPLFPIHGYSDNQISKDVRVRAELELRKLNLHGSDYARNILSKLKPPTVPRKDHISTQFQNTFNNFD